MPTPDPDFETLLHQHREGLRRFLFTLTACQSSAEDLVQETQIRLWQKKADYRPNSNFKAWAFQMAFNLARNHRRKTSRALESTLPDEALMEKLARLAETHSEQVPDRSGHLQHCLERLQSDQRQLVVRRYVQAVPVQQLATESDRTPNAVSQTLFRIKKQLRACIEKQSTPPAP